MIKEGKMIAGHRPALLVEVGVRWPRDSTSSSSAGQFLSGQFLSGSAARGELVSRKSEISQSFSRVS